MQLPECLRIIGYLRRIGVFNEYEMRLQVRLIHLNNTGFYAYAYIFHLLLVFINCIWFIIFTNSWPILPLQQFLRCREAWLSGILDDLDQRNAYEYLKGMINCHRMHLFDVVNQYRAIFADDTSGREENYDGGLLFSWAMHQISSHLRTLKMMLPKITEGGSLSNILDQCMVSTYLSVPDCSFGIILL